MLLTDFDFPFEPSLIADRPVDPREQAKLMVLPRAGGPFLHRRIADLPDLLKRGDLVVVNDTKVMPARVLGHKRPTGGRVEMLFVKDLGEQTWEVLLKGDVRAGQLVDLGADCQATVVERTSSRTVVRIAGPHSVSELLGKVGLTPLPPYIKRQPCEADRRWYQTVFAEKEGAIAAPTAGLHFTGALLNALSEHGIQVATMTLHVGPGTFLPVKAEQIHEHRMAAEWFEVSREAAEAVRRTKANGGRVVAIGTTVVRSLEAAADAQDVLKPVQGETDMFIVPGYRFRVVDGLLTNFHLPRTTLLMLVSALVGVERLREAYREAVRLKYRFYSYGDAMLIL